MSEKKYYLAFSSSEQLVAKTDELLDRRQRGVKDSHIPIMESTMDYFIPELLHAFLVGTVDAIGLSGMATKVVHSTADVLGKTSRMIIPHILKKRSNKELDPMIDFVDEVYIRQDVSSNGKSSTGCEIDKATYDRIKRVVQEIRDGNGEEVRDELNDLMSMTVDLLLEGLMKRAVNLVKHGFVVRKIIDGAVSTCRAAGHGVVNKVFKKLDGEQMLRLAEYFDTLVISAER